MSRRAGREGWIRPRQAQPAGRIRRDAAEAASRTQDERTRLRERYEEVAALAGGLAHEIRNPLSTIGMLLELMAEDLSAPESPRDRRLWARLQTVQTRMPALGRDLERLPAVRAGRRARAGRDRSQPARAGIHRFLSARRAAARDRNQPAPGLGFAAGPGRPLAVAANAVEPGAQRPAGDARRRPAGAADAVRGRPRPLGDHRQRRRHGRGDPVQVVPHVLLHQDQRQRPGAGDGPQNRRSAPREHLLRQRARAGNPVFDFVPRPPHS